MGIYRYLMVFTKFVEVGRVAMINYGPSAGRLAVIVDIISTVRFLIDGPTTNVRRQEMSVSRLTLSEFVIEVPRGVKRAALIKAINEFGLEKKWGQTSWARQLNRRARRAQLTDFDRFKVMGLRQKRRLLQNKALANRK